MGYHEYMNKSQAAAIFTMVIGLAVMGNATSQDTVASGNGIPTLAFFLAILGMVSFAGAVLAIRTGCIGNLAAWSGFVVRMIVFLVLGVIAFGYSVLAHGWPVLNVATLGVPIMGGFVQAAGVLCVNKAL